MNILHINHHFSQTLKKERMLIFVRTITYGNSNPPTIGLQLHSMIFRSSCDAQINGVDHSSKNLKKVRTIKVGYLKPICQNGF
jgi:hypothetical protein